MYRFRHTGLFSIHLIPAIFFVLEESWRYIQQRVRVSLQHLRRHILIIYMIQNNQIPNKVIFHHTLHVIFHVQYPLFFRFAYLFQRCFYLCSVYNPEYILFMAEEPDIILAYCKAILTFLKTKAYF